MIFAKVKQWLTPKRIFGTGSRSLAGTAEESSTTRTDTEFSAEVVRVTQVLPHPNADRLEILRFEMKGIGETTYEVVSGKGAYAVGDLAAYFSVDCILPTAHPDFAFLLERLDGKGKTHYRLRAARLRGVFSQGLLVPLCSQMPETTALERIYKSQALGKLGFGTQVAEQWGVTYHRKPEPGENGVPTPGKKPTKQPMPIYTVDSLKKLPRLFEEGERVCVTEKIHGTNFRFGWVRRRVLGIPFGWKFVVGSHRVIKDGTGGNWYEQDVWTEAADRMRLAEKTRGYKGHVFYGELYGYTYTGQKIQDLTYGRAPTEGPGLVIFDVKGPDGYLDVWTRRNLCAELELDHVPILSLGPELSTMEFISVEVKQLAEGKSVIAPGQIREGVVIESTEGLRRKAKFVGESYLMRKGADV